MTDNARRQRRSYGMLKVSMPPANATPEQKSAYDFLNNEPRKQKRSLLPRGLSFRRKIAILAGGAVIIMLIIGLISSVFLNGSGANIEQIRQLAIEQNELIRVADIGSSKARSSTALNYAVTTKATLTSDQKATTAYLTLQKQKLGPKDLATGKNAKTDDLLRRAEQANQFDDVFMSTMQTELKAYQAHVKKAYDETSSKKAKAVLADNYNHIKVLTGN